MNYLNILNKLNEVEYYNNILDITFLIKKVDIDNDSFIIKLYKNNIKKDECIFYKDDYINKDFFNMINDYIEEFIKY